MPAKLSEKQIMMIKKEFIKYKIDKKLTTKEIARKLGVNNKTIWFYFRRFFGNEYEKVAKQKTAWNTKVDEKLVKQAFEKYKNGALTSELEKELGLKNGSLLPRLRKIIGKGYTELAKRRQHIDAGKSRKKRISDEAIKDTFKKYKRARIPIENLAESIGMK
ncbi:MAG: hypothetical protein HZB67_04065, partial [Candidatus Aenigmarchaeota archaeon]|nr:hypothetical protein [Candidatus Aenigmarchaeota archaeon]